MPTRAAAALRTSGTSPYATVKAALRERIAKGGWQAGTRLPSERELVHEFGCARMTVHRALRELEEEGLIERRQGSGSYVAELHPISNLLQVRDIHDEIRERGHAHATRICQVARARCDAAIAAAMRLRKGAPVFRVQLVHLVWDNRVAEFPEISVGASYIPIPVAGVITLLFCIERLWLGQPPPDSFTFRDQPQTE